MSIFTYSVHIDTQRDGAYGDALDDVTNYVEHIDWRFGLTEPWGKVAPSANMRVMLANADGRFSTHDSSADYYGLLVRGVLVRIKASYDGRTETLAVLKVKDIDVKAVGAGSPPAGVVTLICTDIMHKLLESQYEAPLLLDVRVDTALQKVYEDATIIYPYDSKPFYIGRDSIGSSKLIYMNTLTDFDKASKTLPFIGDNLDKGAGVQAQTYIKEAVSAEMNSIFFFDVRSEKFKFFNSYHNKILNLSPPIVNTNLGSFDMDDYVSISIRQGEKLINDYRLNYVPRAVGTPASVIYQGNVPIQIRAQSRRDFKIRYTDPDNISANVGAMDVIRPEAGFDITANSEEDGSGVDVSSLLTLGVFTATAGSADFYIQNTTSDDIYIQKFEVRGTPIINYETEQVRTYDGNSVYDNDRHPRTETIKSISTYADAVDYALFVIRTFAPADAYIRSVTLVADEARSSIGIALLERTIGDVVSLVDDSGINKEYMIVGEKHSLPSRTKVHNIQWILRPVERGAIFVIGASSIGSRDILL